MRLFVAVDLPQHVKAQLAEIVTELRACQADVRWVTADSMHVTLKFLGDVEPRNVEAIDAALRRVVGAVPPTRGRLCGLGSFPHQRRPRVLWAGVRVEDARLSQLHAAVEACMAPLGFPPERRAFHPHVTLGRVRGGHGISALQQQLELLAGALDASFSITEVTLFESRLRRGGPRYLPAGTFRMGR